MKFVKSVVIHDWDETVRRNVVRFWTERGVRFAEIGAHTLRGNRGSWWGNATAFDMSQVRTIVTISVVSPAEIVCVLDIDTSFQIITPWNETYWRLELETFESWLSCGDDKEDSWQAYNRAARKSDVRWVLSFGIFGSRTPPSG